MINLGRPAGAQFVLSCRRVEPWLRGA